MAIKGRIKVFRCRRCGDILITPHNWYPSYQKKCNYICKKCEREQRKEYFEKWWKDNWWRIKSYSKNFYQKHQLKLIEKARAYREKIRLALDLIIGDKCIVCGSKKNLICHEIHGRKHPHQFYYPLKKPEDFVRMCKPCHSFLHSVERHIKNKEKFIMLVRKLGS